MDYVDMCMFMVLFSLQMASAPAYSNAREYPKFKFRTDKILPTQFSILFYRRL